MDDPFAPVQGIPYSLIIGGFRAWRLDYVFPVECAIGPVTIPQKPDGSFEATSALTSAIPAGENRFDVYAVRADGERIVIRSEIIICYASTEDAKSHARKMLAKIESILFGRADADVSSYSIKQRSITKMSVDELMQWRNYYLAEVGRERDPITGERRQKNNTLRVGFRE